MLVLCQIKICLFILNTLHIFRNINLIHKNHPIMADKKEGKVTTIDSKDLSEKFGKIRDQILKVAVDFTTLNVTTLSGNYSHIINTEKNGKRSVRTKFHDFTEELGKPGNVKAKVELVAHTHVDFDHDTVNFVSKDVNPNGDFLFDIHNAALDSAKSSRGAFIRMLREFVK